MKITLGKFAKKYKLTRYEILRMISKGQLEYDIVMKDGKKSYLIYEDSFISKNREKHRERFECGEVVFELIGEELVMIRDGKRVLFKRV